MNSKHIAAILILLLLILGAFSYSQSIEIQNLNKLHDADVEEMIRLDQAKQKPVKHKKHKPVQCIEVIHVA